MVDLPILGLGLANLTLANLYPARAQLWAALALGLMLAYLAFRALVHHRLRAAVQERFPGARPVSVIPALLGWNRWRYVAEFSDRVLVGWVRWRPLQVGTPQEKIRVEDRIIAASLSSPLVQLMRRFSRHPRAEWEPAGDGYQVRWYDLRYEFGRFTPFAAHVYLDPELNLVDDRLGQARPDPKAVRSLIQEEFRSSE